MNLKNRIELNPMKIKIGDYYLQVWNTPNTKNVGIIKKCTRDINETYPRLWGLRMKKKTKSCVIKLDEDGYLNLEEKSLHEGKFYTLTEEELDELMIDNL